LIQPSESFHSCGLSHNGHSRRTVTARAEALDVLSSAFFNAHKVRLVELAAKYRLPAMYEHGDRVRRIGVLLPYTESDRHWPL
jgi:hypothetical protein